MSLRARAGAALLVLLALSLGGSCAARRPVVLLPQQEPAHPVVFIPGMTGTQLRDASTGRVMWGTAHQLLFPRDGGHRMALPVDATAPVGEVEPFAPILELRLFGLWRKQIYGPLLQVLQSNGFRLGRLETPDPQATLFVLNYDWRRSVIEGAQRLARQLEELRVIRGEDRLSVTLICQSNGALLARYFLKYGGASLEAAEAGRGGLPETIRVEKLVFLGPANGGALRVFEFLHLGRSYVSLIGRRLQPETLFTFTSLYESLPVDHDGLFVDTDGQPLEANLFDARDWERFGWSIYANGAAGRIARSRYSARFGETEQRSAFLRTALENAARLHRLLQADPPKFEPPRYYSIRNVYARTPIRALLVSDGTAWTTLFPGKRRVRKDPYLAALTYAPGDGHASVRSQNELSPLERSAFARPPADVDGAHFEFILSPATERLLLEFLRE